MRILALGFLFLIGLSNIAYAGIAGCDGSVAPTPLVDVYGSLPEVVETHDYSYHDFTSRESQQNGQDTLGLSKTKSIISYQPDIEYSNEGDHVCARLISVDMTFGYQERTIYIAREAPLGSCIYDQVKTHEYRHAATDAYILSEYSNYIKTELARAAAGFVVIRARTGKDAAQLTADRIAAAMKPVTDYVWSKRDDMQKQIDSPEEYGRISSVCRVDIGRYIRGR